MSGQKIHHSNSLILHVLGATPFVYHLDEFLIIDLAAEARKHRYRGLLDLP